MRVISCKLAKEQGLPKYFTGKPCKHGHLAERRVSDRGCVECSALATARHRAKYPQKNLEAAKAYRLKNPGKVKATKIAYREKEKENARARYAKNPEAFRQMSKGWRIANPEKAKECRMRFVRENPKYANEKSREWYSANIEAARASARQRARETCSERKDYMAQYMREYYAANKSTFYNRAKAWREANPEKCRQYHANRKSRIKGAEGFHTGEDIEALRASQGNCCNACMCCLDESGFHVDHIVPISKGGSNWPSNLQLLCPSCNLSKGSKDFTEWLDSRIAA